MFPPSKQPIKHREHKKFFMIYGAMRSGTQWLAHALRDNIDAEYVNVTHEGWRPDRIPRVDKLWRDGPPGAYVSVGQGGYAAWRFIQKTYKPTTAFLWREELAHARSILSHRTSEKTGIPFLCRLFLTFAAYEAVLAACAQDKTPHTHWHLDQYTLPVGLRKMCATIKLPLKNKLVLPPPINNTPADGARSITGTEDCVEGIYAMFPRCRAARRSAALRLETT